LRDVAKSKRGRKPKLVHEENAWFESDGTINVEETQSVRQALGEAPTQYQAPGEDQKWRARNVISFHWRHLGIKIPPGYRDVMLCAIDHANPSNGRCDAGQSRMARECNLGRQYVNEAMQWWASSTDFIQIENRNDRHGRRISNAYHIDWDALEAAWHAIQWAIHREVTSDHVATDPTAAVAIDTTPGVATDPTAYVVTDPTLNIKRTSNENLKEEPRPERVQPPSAADTTPLEGKKEGNQGEPFTKAPSFSESQRESAAARLEADLLRLPGSHYSAVVEWLPFPGEVYDAAIAAEVDAPNTGAVVVLDAYRKERKELK
jgi:hypothetical protein